MSNYDMADLEVLSFPYKHHGPGGTLPIVVQMEKENAPAEPKVYKDISVKTKPARKAENQESAFSAIVKCAKIFLLVGALDISLYLASVTAYMDFQTSWLASIFISMFGGLGIAWTFANK